ncbi:PAS domain-containing protein [Azospirillum tabaci]|uniref:PAS domain-containing protein n=1 Tax=Azospirillum tabaci TaxID=2752310 RepID=UPI0016601174|nr:PAS domain S-box protein [Azospirillum tabaci]
MTENDLQRLGLALLNSPAEAIAYSDREGIIRFWNAGAERVFGFTADEALGQSLDIIIPDRQRQRHWDGYDQVMKTGESRYGSGDLLSVPATRKDGTRISVEFTIVPLKDADGAMLGMAAVMRDVTARFDELRALRRQAAGR